MRSYRSFVPGGSRNHSRVIQYTSQFPKTCYCVTEKYDKSTLGSTNSSVRQSYATRISQAVQATKGGKIQFGNFYLGKPLELDYLGQMEGIPGGRLGPPLNRF